VSEIEVLPRILIHDREAVYEGKDGLVPMNNVDSHGAIDKLLADFEKVLIVDMNGVHNNRPKLDFIRDYEKKSIWVDGGARKADNAIDLFIAGAERVVLRTETLVSMEELRKAHDLSDQLVFELDLTDGRTVNGLPDFQGRRPEDLLKEVAQIGVRSCIYLDESGSVPSPSILHGLPDDFELYVGLLHKSDSARLDDSGIKGIIVDAKELV
jgi:phosphoribosylformimino-5-aminoimidazole carboxamide ribonucleotide (ProFAR) isomerase